jgi:protein-S-isoprenylcysteine O-methyltransferase Ste14
LATEPPPPTPDSLGAAVSEVSEKLNVLVHEEIELAKAEMMGKVASLGRGAAAVAAGAVFGVFGLVFVLLSIAWGINAATGSLWIGMVIVMGVLLLLTAFAFLFAWRKLKVGAPKPTMAIDEARKIKATVTAGDES